MESLKDSSISQLKQVPGLFISDRFAARSASLLKELGIKFILSVTHSEDVPKFRSQLQDERKSSDFEARLVMKHIDINDDPTEDLLYHLKDACDWIESNLSSGKKESKDAGQQSGVLVHCTQGISRSGSVVIAYLMRTLSLTYSSALWLARESRTIIMPNPGFEEQLRIWEHCKYVIFMSQPEEKRLQEKPAYRAWKANRDALLGRGEEAVNKARFASMANMVAAFGKRRIEAKDEEGGKQGGTGGMKGKGWENVETMEKEWTKKLIARDYEPLKKKNEEE